MYVIQEDSRVRMRNGSRRDKKWGDKNRKDYKIDAVNVSIVNNGEAFKRSVYPQAVFS